MALKFISVKEWYLLRRYFDSFSVVKVAVSSQTTPLLCIPRMGQREEVRKSLPEEVEILCIFMALGKKYLETNGKASKQYKIGQEFH